jgi:hypothetical protein
MALTMPVAELLSCMALFVSTAGVVVQAQMIMPAIRIRVRYLFIIASVD